MKKTLLLVLCVAMMAMVFAGCTGEAEPAAKASVRIAALKGPTGMGVAKLMSDDEAGLCKNDYDISLVGSPDEIVSKITSKEVDIAAVPTNLAAVLYKKTSGGVKFLAANTLGVLYMLENGEAVNSVADLAGKTIGSSGQGSMPEYILDFVLAQNDVTDATVVYESEHAALAAKLLSGDVDIAMLPEPFVTSTMAKGESLRVALDITDEWGKASDKAGMGDVKLVQGCMIVRAEFAEQNPEAVKTFMDEYTASAKYTNESVKDAAALIAKYGIVASPELAEKAIPKCNITCIPASEAKASIDALFSVLHGANPASVGGELPDENFYYIP